MAALTSLQELTYVQQLCGQIVNGCWVGGHGIKSAVGFHWKWSDNTSHWNASIYAGASFDSNCSNFSCHDNTGVDLCTLVNNGSKLVDERCNKSHAFICMLDAGIPP